MLASRACFLLALALSTLSEGGAVADVVVLANRAPRSVDVRVMRSQGAPSDLRLAAGQSRPFFSDGGLRVSFVAGGRQQTFTLLPNTAAFFGETREGEIGLQHLGLGEDETTASGHSLPASIQPRGDAAITVLVLVDDDEPHRRQIWERRLRDRVQRASEILSAHSGIEFRVVGVATWQSDNSKTDFTESLREFESVVSPGKARLALGFTSQYEARRGRLHLGGTRGPLRRHILLREWSGVVSERERLELLLHELGHFLGATHSPEQSSVMRPVLGDRQARRKDFTVRYDPVNTLIMSMVGEEIRRRRVTSFAQMTSGTKLRLRQIYAVMHQAMPKDNSAKQFLQRIGKPRRVTVSASKPVRQVLQAIASAANRNARLPEVRRREGDALTEHYVRVAAKNAISLPESQRAKVFLLALGIAMDPTATVRSLPAVGDLAKSVESAAERKVRISNLGKPAMESRHDLATHFFVSALITAASDAATAGRMGIAKEVIDMQRSSGFSFADIAADRAGIRFAESVLSGRLTLTRLADGFRVPIYMPAVDDLPEGLNAAQFIEQFGGVGDERFTQQLEAIRQRINALPPYMVLKIVP